MTREEAINNIKEFQNTYITCRGEEDTVAVSLDGFDIEAFDMAIKALEQEPFINKPCVSSEVCEHDKNKVLDKIRAEIIENSIEDYKYHGCGTDELIIETSEVLQIIDKYKAESEG